MKTTKKTPSKPAVVDQDDVSPQENFKLARTALCAALVERDDEIDLTLTAILASEHVLFVGPPGVAKSHLLRSLKDWMGGTKDDYFEHLMTKFTTPEELFGPISVKGLKDDRYARITKGKLPVARLVFLDEFFKASSAIANTVLTCMNERLYDNGDGPQPIPLLTLMAASNEWPNDDNGGKELNALFDRILFRKVVKPISDTGMRSFLKRKLEGDEFKPDFATLITPEEIMQAQHEAARLPWSDDAKKALWEIRLALRGEGIVPGDRRMGKSLTAASASAYLAGSDKVLPEHLEVLSHVLWDDPTEQPIKCEKVVARIANPLGVRVMDLQQQAQDVESQAETQLKDMSKSHEREGVCRSVLTKLEEIRRDLVILKADDRRDRVLNYVNEALKDWQYRLIGANRE